MIAAAPNTMKLLLIEDNPGDADLAREYLSEGGEFEPDIVHVTTLSDAIESLRTNRFDAALLDLNLPDSQGTETIARLRAVDSELPIAVMSGMDASDLTHIYEIGAQDYIPKGELSATLLRRLVHDSVERHRGQEKQRHLEHAVTVMPDAVIVTDPEGKVHFANAAAERLFGQNKEAIVGEILDFSLAEGEIVDMPIQRGAEKRIAEVRVANFRWKGMPAWLALLRDVTEHRNVVEQLRHAQRMEAVGQLAGGIAHDFNNLISVINGYADMAMKSLPDGDVLRADLQEIRNAGQRAAQLTQQLLAFSRKQVIQPQTLDLRQIIIDQQKYLGRLLGEHIDFSVKCDENVGAVTADRGQIEQVIMNLAVNARDAMPTGGRLSVTLKNVELESPLAETQVMVPTGRYALLSVSDTGEGMDNITMGKIFEPFFTTKERGKGTGLGLATVYGIIKQNGGYIFVYSEKGQGTVFKIYLPNSDDSTATDKSDRLDAIVGGNETILVVEDEHSLRVLTERILKDVGYTVIGVADAGSAIECINDASHTIDMLLTDVVLPGRSGPELVEELRANRISVRVLYMSGYSDDMIGRHGVIDADTNFIGKPFTSEDLLRRVRSVLDAKV